MSDTPRTDDLTFAIGEGVISDAVEYVVLAKDAKALERELSEANAKIAELESMRDNWRVSSVCRELRAEADAMADALEMKECFGHPSCALQHYRNKYPKP